MWNDAEVEWFYIQEIEGNSKDRVAHKTHYPNLDEIEQKNTRPDAHREADDDRTGGH